MKIVVIDYGAGNVQSILFALERLGYQGIISNDPLEIKSADRVIFPGVGAAGPAMEQLKTRGLTELIPGLRQPVLGICLGMQLMCRRTAEGNTTGLGIFPRDVQRFGSPLKVPQMGWNTIHDLDSPLFREIKENEYMYLVHSYYVPSCKETIGLASYGIAYSVALQKDNFYGVQFHPEKSSAAGERILMNFLTL